MLGPDAQICPTLIEGGSGRLGQANLITLGSVQELTRP